MRSASCPGANGLCQRMLEVWPDDRPASRVCRDPSAVRAEVCGRTHGPRAKPTALRVLRAPRHAPGRRAPFASPRLGTVHRSGGVISDSVSGRLPDVAICSTWSHEPTDGLCSASTTSRRQAGLKNGVLAGSCPPRVLPTTSLGRSARTNAPHEGCTHAGPGRTRRFRAHSQHRTQSVFMHGSVAKQPY